MVRKKSLNCWFPLLYSVSNKICILLIICNLSHKGERKVKAFSQFWVLRKMHFLQIKRTEVALPILGIRIIKPYISTIGTLYETTWIPNKYQYILKISKVIFFLKIATSTIIDNCRAITVSLTFWNRNRFFSGYIIHKGYFFFLRLECSLRKKYKGKIMNHFQWNFENSLEDNLAL